MARTFAYTTEVFDEYTDFPQTGDVDTIYIDASKNKAYRYDQSYYPISSEGVDIWGAIGSLSKGSGGGGGGGGGGGASWGSINGTLSNQTDLNTALSAKQNSLTLTTTGASGAATLVDSTLNIPQYSGGGAIHALVKPRTGTALSACFNGAIFNSTNTTANRLTAQAFIPANTFTCSNLYINVGVIGVGVNGRILIYSDNNGLPNTKLYESSNLDCSTLGIKTATTSFTFNAGTIYWLCTHCSGTASLRSFPPANVAALLVDGISNISSYIYTYTFGSAPTTLSGQGNSLTAIPAVFITVA